MLSTASFITTILHHYTGQPALADTPSEGLEDFVGASLLPTCPF